MFTLIPTRKVILTALTTILGAVSAFAQTGSLAGLVTDESTKKPIEGVTIEVYKTELVAKHRPMVLTSFQESHQELTT
jgi:hypothetical protein